MKKSTYIIAEVGPNHNGSLDTALKMIERISKTGVDAIKFQLTDPYLLYSDDSFKVSYQKKNDSATSPREMSLKYQLRKEEHILLHSKCIECKVDYICSAFDIENLVYIDKTFDLPYYKIASGEIFSIDMIDYISLKKKPIILSTGMATYSEIETVVQLLNRNFDKEIIILHCVSNYPAPPNDINLNSMLELKNRFGYDIGYSDHSEGNDASIAAVALGATMIEKHVTLDKNMSGPDHKASITVDELSLLVKSIRNVEKMKGSSDKVFSDAEIKIKAAVRKSIVANKDLPVGHILLESDICFKRPGTGISPLHKEQIIGKILKVSVKNDRLIKLEYFTNK